MANKNSIFEDVENTQPISFNIEEGSTPNININFNVDPNTIKDSSINDFLKDLNIDIKDYDVLIVEDILESGYTLECVMKMLSSRKPRKRLKNTLIS